MTGSYLITRSSQSDFVEDGNVILDDSGFSHYKTGRMIKKDPRSDAGCRMDIHTKDFTSEALKIESHGTTRIMPEVIRNPVSRNGKEALVVYQGLQSRVARRISFQDRLQVITSPFNQNRVLLEETGQEGSHILERRILSSQLTR